MRLRGYPRETVVAEKTHALVTLGTLNRRMKDFYDLWLITRQFDFDQASLLEAIRRTFAHRNTDIAHELPEALMDGFGHLKQAQWQAFLQTSGVSQAPEDLAPMFLTSSQRGTPKSQWPAPGPWNDQVGD